MAVKHHGETLSLTGVSHRLDAMPVGGTKWIGMFHIESPTNAAMLQPDEARALVQWLTERLEEHSPWKCSCEHSEGTHTGQFEDEEDTGCMVADCPCKTYSSTG